MYVQIATITETNRLSTITSYPGMYWLTSEHFLICQCPSCLYWCSHVDMYLLSALQRRNKTTRACRWLTLFPKPRLLYDHTHHEWIKQLNIYKQTRVNYVLFSVGRGWNGRGGGAIVNSGLLVFYGVCVYIYIYREREREREVWNVIL